MPQAFTTPITSGAIKPSLSGSWPVCDRVVKKDVRYRFVIDMASLKS